MHLFYAENGAVDKNRGTETARSDKNAKKKKKKNEYDANARIGNPGIYETLHGLQIYV